MARIENRKALILGAALLVPVVFLGAFWLWWSTSYVPSNIVDFHPKAFQAKATSKFFYSFGDELKFGNEVSPQSPTLMRGSIGYFVVSPDSRRIAVVVSGKLEVVSRCPLAIRQVVPVDSIFREPKPLGRQFFRDFEMQWSQDSKILYLVKDEFYETKGGQLFSDKAELWGYDVNANRLWMVLKPFPAGSYFLGQKSGIYFSVPTENGDLQLRCFDGKHTHDIRVPYGQAIPVEQLNASFRESPFFSFDDLSGLDQIRTAKYLSTAISGANGVEWLEAGNKRLMAFTRGVGLKGPYYCDQADQGVFLPGNRYFLFSNYCGNYEGQILLDTRTGDYERLPKGSRVYLTFNTESYFHYKITVDGIKAE
ncbi:MAG: hypothetical protein WA700_16500 [Acidobacteriaceae bacterium]